MAIFRCNFKILDMTGNKTGFQFSIIFLLTLFIFSGVQAQHLTSVRINEVSVINENLEQATTGMNNQALDTNDKIENFKKNDKWGVGITLVSMMVVFTGLLLLFLLFKYTGKTAIQLSKQRAMKAGVENMHDKDNIDEGAVVAAIAAAIFEVTEGTHDIESTVLTIQKVTRRYSPWSSKIYGMRELLRK